MAETSDIFMCNQFTNNGPGVYKKEYRSRNL